MTTDPTVLVVGGGATGAGVARDLALRDVDVMLVDRDGLASGTSGRSHGLLHSGARYAEADLESAEECLAENRILKDIAGACIRDTGGLFVRLAEDNEDYFERKMAACNAAGIEVQRLDGDEAREQVAGLSDDVVEAFRVPDRVVYPSRLVAANAADAEAHGAAVRPHTPVTDVTVSNERIDSVELGGDVDGTVRPEIVVNAAGAWAGQLAEMAGATVGMAPSRGVMVAVEYDDLEPVLNRCREPDDGDIIVPHEGEVVLGTTSVPVDDPDEYDRPDWEVERSVSECAAMLPSVADARTVRTWWGVRPLYAPDEAGSDRRGISRGFTVIDHADEGVSGLVSVVGGKLTTYRRMAEVTADRVCAGLGIDATCETATRRLPAVDDTERLDELVGQYGGANPTDSSTVGTTTAVDE